MKLRFSPFSPFVRKVRIVAMETGQDGQIDIVPTNTADPAAELWRDNPLIKIPALVLDNGDSLYDSAVICEYLDSLHRGPKLIPTEGSARWTALRRQALADGVMEAAVLRRYESVRPQNLQSSDWDAQQKRKVDHGLAAFEQEIASFGDTINIASISVGAMLGYLNFRFAGENWVASAPKLAAWYATFSKRPSMTSTVPPQQ